MDNNFSPYPHLQNMNLKSLAERMKDLGEQDQALKEAKAEIYKEWDYIRKNSIPSKMDEEGISTINFTGIGRVQLAGDLYTRTLNPAGLADWLRSNDAGDLIKEQVNGSSLKSFIKECISDGHEIPDEYVEISPFTRASIVKG